MNARSIFLYGPPASGKTTLARALGDALGMQALDTDRQVVERAGRPIAEIFATAGEEAFRALESSVLEEDVRLAAERPCVIALGGGTLLSERNRMLCEQTGTVFCLESPSREELTRRLNLAAGSRPLGDRSEERAAHYASFPSRVAASFSLPDSLVLAGTKIAGAFLRAERTAFDENVARLHPRLSEGALAIIPSGGQHRTPATIQNLLHDFAVAGLGRQDTVMACGGGATGEMTGFAAATWMQGIPWWDFPTTLLSMVDVSTGGKTGCGLPGDRNPGGAFHSPRLLVIDTLFLDTLPEKELRAGRAEMLKHQILQGKPSPVRNLTAGMLAENLAVKVGIVREDPFGTNGRRMLLSCGHTVAHALELALHCGISHGEAVAIGCVEEARQAVRMGLAPAGWPRELEELFQDAGLPAALPDGVTFQTLSPLMRGDKKRQGNAVTFALPCGWGDVRLVKLELA